MPGIPAPLPERDEDRGGVRHAPRAGLEIEADRAGLVLAACGRVEDGDAPAVLAAREDLAGERIVAGGVGDDLERSVARDDGAERGDVAQRGALRVGCGVE